MYDEFAPGGFSLDGEEEGGADLGDEELEEGEEEDEDEDDPLKELEEEEEL